MLLGGFSREALEAQGDLALCVAGDADRPPRELACVRYIACGMCATLRHVLEDAAVAKDARGRAVVPLGPEVDAQALDRLVAVMHGVEPVGALGIGDVHRCLDLAAWLGADALEPVLLDRLAELCSELADTPEDMAARFSALVVSRAATPAHARFFWQALVDLAPFWFDAKRCVENVQGWCAASMTLAAECLTSVYHPALVLDALLRLSGVAADPADKATAITACSKHFHPREGLLYTGLYNRAAGVSDLDDDLRPMLEKCSDLPENQLRASCFSFGNHVSLLVQVPAKRPAARRLAPWLSVRVMPDGVTAEFRPAEMREWASGQAPVACPAPGPMYVRVMPYTQVVRRFQHCISSYAETWHRCDPAGQKIVALGPETVWRSSGDPAAVLPRAKLVRVDFFLAGGIKVV